MANFSGTTLDIIAGKIISLRNFWSDEEDECKNAYFFYVKKKEERKEMVSETKNLKSDKNEWKAYKITDPLFPS